jgi:hypothetical protein
VPSPKFDLWNEGVSMNQRRWQDDNDKFKPQSNRYIYSNNFWYFQTREEGVVGPFTSKTEAEQTLCQFLMELLEKNQICPI